jgi:hypothetical protein
VIGTETALGFMFDPREKDFSFAALTMAAFPFAAMTQLNGPKKSAPWRKRHLPAHSWWRPSMRRLAKGRTIGSRCGLVLPIYCLRLRCGGRALEKNLASRLPFWVKSVGLALGRKLPVFLYDPTFGSGALTEAMGQTRK